MEEDLLNAESLAKTVVAISVEVWRFKNVFERLILYLPPSERPRYAGQYAWFNRKIKEALNESGIRIIDLKGQEFSAAATPAFPVNLQEFSEDDVLIIDQILEPMILSGDKILNAGTVVLKKRESASKGQVIQSIK